MYNKITFYLLTVFLILGLQVNAQTNDNPVVMTIDGEPVTKTEFLRIYLKNNDDPKFDKAALDQYMELFTEFKLKVAEAEALGYDTIPTLRHELQGYHDQLAKPYLVDTSKTQELIKEGYERMKYEVRASHILIALPKNAAPEDTLKAYQKALKVRDRILNGEPFEEVAKATSDDNSVDRNNGDLGYFTAFQMVYPFENAAYNLKEGEISMPVRSSYGYHIVKVTGKRPARGTIKVAHIMVAMNPNPSRTELEKAKSKIDEVYQKLQEGVAFEKLAQLYSDDRATKDDGGELPAFGTGTTQRMIAPFENAAFSLKKDGDYSKPFRTDYGFHIVKRISLKPLGSFEDLKPTLEEKIKRGDRGKISEEAFIQNLKANNPFKDKSRKRLGWFYDNIDSTIYSKDWKKPTLKKNKWIFKYQDVKYDMQSFYDYFNSRIHRVKMPPKTLINTVYKEWQDKMIMKDEKSRLAEKYPEYKALLKEYHDGILLYEIMKNKVWNKAILDSVGLRQYYESNIEKYQWPNRIEATIFSSNNKNKVLEAQLLIEQDSLNNPAILDKVNAESQLNLSLEEGKYTQDKNPILKGRDLTKGINPIFEKDNIFYLIILEDKIPAGPKKLKEARGEIIQDYQNYLEENWVKKLKEKHTVTIHKDILYNLGN